MNPKLDAYFAQFPLPPYGVLNDHFTSAIRERRLFPCDWIGYFGLPGTLLDQWTNWKADTLDIISEVLWPRFDLVDGWHGSSAARMAELTRTDLKLMSVLAKLLDKPASVNAPTTNLEFFENEDTQARPFGSMHAAYDPTLPYRLLEEMPRTIAWCLGTKAGTAAPQIKQVLQRPRAYQVAQMWGLTSFSCQRAISGDSPSMCSGHCFEGCTTVGGVMERFLLDKQSLSPTNWQALQQYAVDIGDRRVMAGVHYPSDNLASWLMVMRVADHVYQDRSVKTRLWAAISQQSKVSLAIQDAIRNGVDGDSKAGEVYRPAWEAITRAAQQSQ